MVTVNEGDPRAEIVRIEKQINVLADSIERVMCWLVA
jgi:hypothetical protein